jgi:hypothetical protein
MSRARIAEHIQAIRALLAGETVSRQAWLRRQGGLRITRARSRAGGPGRRLVDRRRGSDPRRGGDPRRL